MGCSVGVVTGVGQWAWGSYNNILAWLADTKLVYLARPFLALVWYERMVQAPGRV